MANNYTLQDPYSGQNYVQPPANYTYAQQYGTATYDYQAYSQSQYSTTTPQTSTVRSSYPTNWIATTTYNVPAVATAIYTSAGQNPAVVNEINQQKAQLLKQREEYVRKVLVLRRELELLKNQKNDLRSGSSPPCDLDSIVRENDKLQDEIQTKMKAITNVIEMLSGIIKDGMNLTDLEMQFNEEAAKKNKRSKSPEATQVLDNSAHYNYIHYDPELHWCRLCDVFPKTAKEFLQHLQSKTHQDSVHESDLGDSTPWHKLPPEPELPHFDNAPKKRIPIKGLQFFISAPSWYCKLCDMWIGDLHCASQHLKSKVHFQNYANFVEQNPHWEMEWLKDREKALSRSSKKESSDSEDAMSKKRKKKRDKRSEGASARDRKKKKHLKKRKKHSSDSSSSSSSSDSSSDEGSAVDDKSKSIRVAMRNVKVESIMNEDLSEKWEMLGRLVEEHKKKEKAAEKVAEKPPEPADKLINQWMTVSAPPEKEKYLLDSLKDRMKQKQTIEKAKQAEIDKKQKEKEQKEKEEIERKQREEKEELERMDKERKIKEREEYERIVDKDRDQVRFKQTIREKYYRKRSVSRSPEKTRSPSREREHYSSSSSRRSPSTRSYRKHSRENGSRTPPPRRSRSRSPGRRYSNRSPRDRQERSSRSDRSERKPPGPPSYKKLPFIGRMPLFKNKKPSDEKPEKELKKEEYEKPRQTRFQPGNLARAFIPEPEVVCFPKLSSYPELHIPPPAPVIASAPPRAPSPPKVTRKIKLPATPPPAEPPKDFKNEDFDPNLYEDPSEIFYPPSMDFAPMYSENIYNLGPPAKGHGADVPLSHRMPLQPPPMPPADDDLAMLGISADDMAAQAF